MYWHDRRRIVVTLVTVSACFTLASRDGVAEKRFVPLNPGLRDSGATLIERQSVVPLEQVDQRDVGWMMG